MANRKAATANRVTPIRAARPLHTNANVEHLIGEVQKTLDFMAQRGLVIHLDALDVNNLRARADSFAACRILIEKGVATEAEVQGEMMTALLGMLRAILQTVEQQQLAQAAEAEKQTDLAVVRQPLAIARR